MNKANKWIMGLLVPTSLLTSIIAYESSGKPVYKPYKDVVGVWTVCNGYTGKDINIHKTYTAKECNDLTIKDIDIHGKGVLECVDVPISHKEYEAYTSFAYNMGVGAFCGSGFLKVLNSGNHRMACQGLYIHPNGKPAWSHADGKYYQGLQNRRFKEYLTCMEGVK